MLLSKLINNDSMHIDQEGEADTLMMQQLYNLFFSWKTDQDEKLEQEAALQVDDLTEDQKIAKAEQEKEDKRKKEEFERD